MTEGKKRVINRHKQTDRHGRGGRVAQRKTYTITKMGLVKISREGVREGKWRVAYK